ncbi:MAG: dihydrolipoyl dehydrogenase family protein [Solirubrobacteraceae bacterium]
MKGAYHLVVVGLGSGGIVAAQFAAKIGLRVAAVERDRVGGDCLWTGCVPSKALIASARTAHAMRSAARVGITPVEPDIDLAAVWRRMRAVQAQIARTDDDPDRLRAIGVEVVEGDARLVGPHTVKVGRRTLDTRFVLLCTGSRPAVPVIAGLEQAGFLTNESLFEVERPPGSLTIVGGGPIGVEIAQAWRRLGPAVTLVERGPQLLARDEPALVARLTAKLRDEGVDVRLGAVAEEAAVEDGSKILRMADGARPIAADELLVAVGRRPDVESLGLEDLGIELAERGVVVDSRLRTTVRSVYAAGDVAGRFAFTHSAAHEAVQAVRNMFFPWHEQAVGLVPWCTFTEPELAHAGLTGTEARARFGDAQVAVHELSLEHTDRARTDAEDEGALVLVTARERLVGAHVLAPAAGEVIHELALAIREKLKLRDLSSLVHVYPTHSTAVLMVAAEAAFQRARRYAWLVRRR